MFYIVIRHYLKLFYYFAVPLLPWGQGFVDLFPTVFQLLKSGKDFVGAQEFLCQLVLKT